MRYLLFVLGDFIRRSSELLVLSSGIILEVHRPAGTGHLEKHVIFGFVFLFSTSYFVGRRISKD